MTEPLTVGTFTVTAIDDGAGHLPPSFYPGADFTAHPGLLDATGTYRIRMGAYLVRGPQGVVLIDAGAGAQALPFPAELAAAEGLTNPPEHLMTSGRLPDSLAGTGTRPEEITAVLLTHLHSDHVGWVIADGEPYFPNATVYYGQDDWASLVDAADPADPGRTTLQAAQKAGVLEPYAGPDVEIQPGIRAVHVPGHTPGSYIIVLASGGQRLYFTGDLIQHPGQLTEANIHFATDTDRSLAQRARAELLARARAENAIIAPAHIADPVFRRITDDGAWAPAAA